MCKVSAFFLIGAFGACLSLFWQFKSNTEIRIRKEENFMLGVLNQMYWVT
jgi:hypothetical protein